MIQGWITRDVEAGKNQALLSVEDLKAKASIALEKQKQDAAERLDRAKFETTLILKATEAPEREAQIRNLRFFVNAGFIHDPDGKIAHMGDAALPSVPPPTSPTSRVTGAENQVAASSLALRASVEALNLLIATEVGSKAQYEAKFSHPVLTPGGGLTIGLGTISPTARRINSATHGLGV